MRPDVYLWNSIKIGINGSKTDYISSIGKYLHAIYCGHSGHRPDIKISVYCSKENMLPPLKKGYKLRKSITIDIEKELEVRIYSCGEEFWYYYQEIADYWLDLRNNRLIISFHEKPYSYDYYNALFFFLYPLGLLLENFGYYRVHSSCVDINGSSVLITGQSGSGKSTSAFALALNGGNIVSDDLTFIKKEENGYSTHTITRLVKLHEATIKRFYPELSENGYGPNDFGEVYFDEKTINSKELQRSVLDSIIILDKVGKSESRVEKVLPSHVISHIFPATIQINNGRFTRNKFDFLTDMLNKVPCYRVFFGTDMKDFYKKIVRMLEGS